MQLGHRKSLQWWGRGRGLNPAAVLADQDGGDVSTETFLCRMEMT